MRIPTCKFYAPAFAIGAILATSSWAAEPRNESLEAAVAKHERSAPQHTRVTPQATRTPKRISIDNPRIVTLHNGPEGTVAGVPGVTVYRNDIDLSSILFYTPEGEIAADDLELTNGACDVVWYEIAVFGEGTSPFPTFNVHTELRTGDMCDAQATVIPGSQADFLGLANDGETVHILNIALPAAVSAPATVWLSMEITSPVGTSMPDAGWIVAREAELGFTDDLFSQDDGNFPGCLRFFRGDPYAGFWAIVNCEIVGDPLGACCTGNDCTQTTEADCALAAGTWQGAFTSCDPSPCLAGACCSGSDFGTCSETTEAECSGPEVLFHELATCGDGLCKPSFTSYVNEFDTGFFDDMATGAQWADDLEFLPCDEVVAYSLTVVGCPPGDPSCPNAAPLFDVRTALWTNDDGGTPEDPTDDLPLARIDGTNALFRDVRSDGFGHTLLAGPLPKIPVNERIWLVFSTSSPDAGPLLGGEANPGFSRDAYAVIDDPDFPASAGAWLGNIFYGGFNPDPVSCPGGLNCVPAGSFHITVWCQGDPPKGTCCNDAAATVVNGVEEAFCDGRWVPDTPAGVTFDPVCGTGACCSVFGCTDMLEAECIEFGDIQGVGVAFSKGSLCTDISCPRLDCIGAAGDCFESHANAGCDDAFCCEAVCTNDEFCCDPNSGWDAFCVNEAGDFCEAVLSNDHCGDAQAISGVGDFTFDTTLATTDGPPHDGCLDGGGENHIINDAWYCWTSPCNGTVTVTSCDLSTVDTKLAVYDGCGNCPPPDADLIACNDDACSANPTQSTVVFETTVGEQKTIRLGMFPSVDSPRGAGQFRILCGVPDNAACPSVGDCCAEHGSVACDDQNCCEKVCAADPACCDTEWDADCAGTGREGTGAGAANLCGFCSLHGDVDGSGFVDLADWGMIVPACFLGPATAFVDPICEAADFDASGHFDLKDAAGFMEAINTPAP